MKQETQEICGLLLELLPEFHAALVQPPAYGEITITVTFHNDQPTRIATIRTEHRLISAPSTRKDRNLNSNSPYNKGLECLNKGAQNA